MMSCKKISFGGEMHEEDQKVQTSSYAINKSWDLLSGKVAQLTAQHFTFKGG